MVKQGWQSETMERKIHGGPLTLEMYHRFFADPWGARITIDHLNHILSMHGFVKLHRQHKGKIMEHLVGQVDLQPPRRSTLHTAARLAAANIVAAQAVADVAAIGWTECPIGSVAGFAGFGEDPPAPPEPMPPPADHVLSLAVRRARSKRTRGSAYARRAASKEARVKEEDLEEGEIWQPPPSPPPLWARSPTPPPPPPSPPRPQTVMPPPPSSTCTVQPKLEPILSSPPGFNSPPPPGIRSPPPPGFGSPQPPCRSRPTLALLPTPLRFVSPPPRCWSQPTLAPLPSAPSGFRAPPPPQLSWGLPLPTVRPPSGPGAPPAFTHHLQPAGPPPLWRPTVPPSYPAPCWGAPSVLPPQQTAWRWPLPPPRWAPPHMQQHQRPTPPWGCMRPSAPPGSTSAACRGAAV
ncbi:extensin-like [Lolium rigidum]|uniref:extensin-like n=1 Tax=Lolium rigidum TaxID=89674 RepID=UPI001F5D9356|nr:extensin-like [Lolium rigidum]